MDKTNQLADIHKCTSTERLQKLANYADLTNDDLSLLEEGLTLEQAEVMIENVIGRYTLPLGIATNFLINGREIAIPLAVEEPSIVAALSHAAKLARAGGGFRTSSSEPIMIGQVQLLGILDFEEAIAKLKAAEPELLAAANGRHPTIQRLGGGAKGFEYRPFPDTPAGSMLVVHLLYDCRDAMGANAVNTAVETVAPLIEQITGGRANLRILSNLSDRRTARAECLIPFAQFTREGLVGSTVAHSIFEAWALAVVDPYRAATHNKGIMNGIDAVALATGNDWRALEAGAHAYAAREGRYQSLTTWLLTTADGQTSPNPTHLKGVLDMPLSVGVVGGATKAHPTAQISMKILGQPNGRGLAEIMVAVGLAQNLGALRALAAEGIQRGHMRLHARQIALAAGAKGSNVQRIADQLTTEGNIREERARELIANLE